MKRNALWKQEDPLTQLRVLLGGIEGDMMNIVAGIAKSGAAERVLEHTRQAQMLATAISKGDNKWEVETSG